MRYRSVVIYINILALEMTSPGNRHCAGCIGTLSFSIKKRLDFSNVIKDFHHVSMRAGQFAAAAYTETPVYD